MTGRVRCQVERGLDVAIGEYAPGRAIVVDKMTYQIGGLYYPCSGGSERTATSPARAFIRDASYRKTVRTCEQCGWFGLEEDGHDAFSFCGRWSRSSSSPASGWTCVGQPGLGPGMARKEKDQYLPSNVGETKGGGYCFRK